MLDTSAEMLAAQSQVFKRMSPEQRFELGLQMIADGCLILEERLRRQMPGSPYWEVQAKRFEQLYQGDLPPEELAACLEGIKSYWRQRDASTD